MKAKILLLTVLALSPSAFAQQLNIKTATKDAILQAIANREAPGTSRRPEKVGVSESSESTGPRAPLFYSAQRNVPPLPFNPFPELQLFDMGENKFVYDDGDVDYVSVRKETEQIMTTQGAYGSEIPGGSGGAPQALLSNGVRLHITVTGSNSYSLLVTNLSPGTEYLLTDKLEFVSDIGAQWQPLFLFTAVSNSATFSGNFPENHQFFEVWDWDAYGGPVVTLANPSSGDVLAGKVKVTGSVGDIFSDRVAELYVDGDLVTAITNGPLLLNLDTQHFSNGVHALDVVVRTVLLTTNELEFATVESRSVTFSNFLSSIDNGPFFSFGTATLKFSTTGAADYTLEIFDEADVLRRTFQGATPGGIFQISWDRRDSGGNLLPIEAGYKFKMTTVDTGGAGAAAAAGRMNQVVINSFAEGTFNAGYAFLLRNKLTFVHGQFEQTEQEQMDRLHSYISNADLFGPDPVATRTVLNDQVFVWQANSQRTNILNSIKRKDVGHFFFVGHGGGGGFGAGADTIITTSISYADLRNTLTNNFDLPNGVYNFRNPKRYVAIDGCNTGPGFSSLAFGIPRLNVDRRPNMARRSYFGWNNIIIFGWYATRYQRHIDDQNFYWHNPDEQVSIQIAMVRAIVEENYQIDIREISLHGSRLLTWAVNAQ